MMRYCGMFVAMCVFLTILWPPSVQAYWGGRGRGNSLALAKRFESVDPFQLGPEDEYSQWDPMDRRLAFADTSSYLPFYHSSLAKKSVGKPTHNGDAAKQTLNKIPWNR